MLVLTRYRGEKIKIESKDGEEIHLSILEIGRDDFDRLYVKLGFIANRENLIQRHNFKGEPIKINLEKFHDISREDKERLLEWYEESDRKSR